MHPVLNADAPLWRARGRRFFDSTVVRHRYFMKDLFRSRSAFSPISRFGIYSRLPDARAFLLRPGFIIFRVAGIYLVRKREGERERMRRRVLGSWFVARSAVPDTRNAGISRRYLRNNYEFFKRACQDRGIKSLEIRKRRKIAVSCVAWDLRRIN